MRISILVVVSFLASGCVGLKVQCDNASEERLAEDYANRHSNPRNFDVFSDQCAKYGYRTPSKEKFHAAYDKIRGEVCATSRIYFLTSFNTYRRGDYPLDCPEGSPIKKLEKEIDKDAWKASLYRQNLDKEEAEDRPAKTFGGPIEIPLPSPNEDLFPSSENSSEKLTALAEKYGLKTSDLR